MRFLDSCAIIAYICGEQRMRKIIDEKSFALARPQLMELYYWALKNYDEDTAEKHYESFSKYEVEISEQTLKSAMKTRLELQKKGLNLSYVDSIGYQYALDNDLRFVTSDPAFKNLKKVKFVNVE